MHSLVWGGDTASGCAYRGKMLSSVALDTQFDSWQEPPPSTIQEGLELLGRRLSVDEAPDLGRRDVQAGFARIDEMLSAVPPAGVPQSRPARGTDWGAPWAEPRASLTNATLELTGLSTPTQGLHGREVRSLS